MLAVVGSLLLDPDLGRYWPAARNWVAAAMLLGAFCLYWGYFAFFEAVWKGQTPGKRHAGIRVISQSGRAINAYEAIARNFLRAIDSLPGVYAVGCIAMFIDPRNRRLGDLVAHTVVVHERKEEGTQLPLESSASDVAATTAAGPNVRLSLQEFELIEAFLSRRLDLSEEVRRQTAHRIAEKIGEKLGAPAASRGSDEDFLELLARRFRDTAQFHS